MYFICSKSLYCYAYNCCSVVIHLRSISFTASKWTRGSKTLSNIKWKFLEHRGPLFPPPYEPLPANVKFYYEDKEVRLSKNSEEMVTFYAKLIEHEYTTKDVFNKNFFKDWHELMTKEEQRLIKDLKKCNFDIIHRYFVEESEKKKNLHKEEKQKMKERNEKIAQEYGFCTIDGCVEKIGNYKIEPPGLFRGRGEHPKMGMLKKRIEPEDVVINCSADSKIPVPPKGHQWKEVIHDNTVTWLGCWKENISDKIKYILLNQASRFHSERDLQKYELARKLGKHVKKIRKDYLADLKSKDMKIKQRAVALYFIDNLALRAGNEKDDDEADTVGCCSLRVEHIQLCEEKDGKKYVVVFDFPGKDCIRYYNEVEVEKLVFNNLRSFCNGKKNTDELFDKLNTNSLNKYLNELMTGLTTKVFRTYNASITLQNQLVELTDERANVSEKLLQYNRANRAVAILCNHQRTVPKTFEKSMDTLGDKIDSTKKQIAEAQKQYKEVKNEIESGTKGSQRLLERKQKKVKKLKEQLDKLKLKQTDKEENKAVALGTSKLNYLDPRISVSWCKKHDVPLEKVYSKTQLSKFQWAIDTATSKFKF